MSEISKKAIKITKKCKYKFFSCNCLVILNQFKLNNHNDYNIFFGVSLGRWSLISVCPILDLILKIGLLLSFDS